MERSVHARRRRMWPMTVRADPAKAGHGAGANLPALLASSGGFSAASSAALASFPERVHLGKRRLAAALFPCAASAVSIAAKRRSNFALVARSAVSGSTSRWRARLTTANSRSPISLGRGVVSAAVERGCDLVGFFADLGEHGLRIVPVEADLAGLLLQLQRARQRRQAGRNAGERAVVAACRPCDAALRARPFPRP